MNLKYYLRGLGIGILVTAIIMRISLGGEKESLTNEEIKQRAKELGMVESTVLAELKVSPSPEASALLMLQTPSGSPAISAVPSTNPASATTPNPSITPASATTPSPSITPASTTTPSPTITPVSSATPSPSAMSIPSGGKEPLTAGMGLPATDVETIEITISSGDDSLTVCKRLEAAGLVSSGSALDTFLYQNGYDKKIRIGTYHIPKGADEKTIAKIISGAP